MSPKAARLAAEAGHTNLRVYNAGMPAWKKAGNVVAVNRTYVGESLDRHHVVIDVRKAEAARSGHIRSAVNLPLERLIAMHKQYRADKVHPNYRHLPGLTDHDAPVVIYGDDFDGRRVETAYKLLRAWRYKNAAVLSSGYADWRAAGMPVAQGATAERITYVKKLAEGAVPADEFAAKAKNGAVTVLDVRTEDEAAEGMIPGAVNIPLDRLEDNLAKLDKSDTIYIHCVSGTRAAMAWAKLKEHGYGQARYLNERIDINGSGEFCINCDA